MVLRDAVCVHFVAKCSRHGDISAIRAEAPPLSDPPGQGQPCPLRLNALTSASVALLLRNPKLGDGRPRDQIEDEARRADTPGKKSRRGIASSHSFIPD